MNEHFTLPAKAKKLHNKKFNKLTLTKPVRFGKNNAIIWQARCDCGSDVDLIGSRVALGHIKSCGCSHTEHITHYNKSRKQPINQVASKSLYTDYKRDAKKALREFDLTFDEFLILISSLCYYCGSKPKRIFKHNKDKTEVPFGGIDRIVSSAGYTLTNTVPCCFLCNRLKSSLDKELFIEQVKKIYKHII